MIASLRSELTKILTQRSFLIGVLAIVGFHVFANMLNLQSTIDAVGEISEDGIIQIFVDTPEPARQSLISLMAGASMQMGLFIPILAGVFTGQEFQSGQIGITFLVTPDRRRALLAKMLASTLVLVGLAALISLVSGIFLYLSVRNWDAGLAVAPQAIQVHFWYTLFVVFYGGCGVAITLLTRRVLATVGITVILMMLTLSRVALYVSKQLDALLPLSAMRNMIMDRELTTDLTGSRVHGLVVLLLWFVLSSIVAVIVTSHRDAR